MGEPKRLKAIFLAVAVAVIASVFGVARADDDLDSLRQRASAGDTEAMVILGVEFRRGAPNRKPDLAESSRWFQLAADRGDPRGMVNLGIAYMYGGGVTRDDAQAVGWFRRGVDAGSANAMMWLGFAYEQGIGGLPQDNAEAIEWITRAAELGDVGAMSDLGLHYESGSMKPDCPKALMWLEKAAKAGSKSDMWELGTMHEFGRCVRSDNSAAVKWYRKAAAVGSPLALESLGQMYESGKGVRENRREALKWYTRAAELGWRPAMMEAAQISLQRGTTDYAAARRWFQAAADKGDGDAMVALGDMNRLGQGEKRDYSAALDLYQRAVERRNQDAALRIGQMYLSGLGVPPDPMEAYFWFTIAEFNHGSLKPIHGRDEAKAQLSKLQVDEGDQRVLQWVETHLDPRSCGGIGIVSPCQADNRWPASGLPH